MTHYATLGVPENASSEDIKKAYRKLAGQHHPDKGGDTATFQRIQEAYSVLSDDNQRANYDAERRGNHGFRFSFNGQPFEQHFGHVDDLFAQFGFSPFGDPFAAHRQQRRNKDLRIRIILDLKDTLEEQNKTIRVQTTNGDSTEVEVKIPRGVTTGTQIKYAGLGDNFFATLARGDLYIQFEVRVDPRFEVHGIDLLTNINVNSIEAIVGCQKIVQGLDDKEFVLNIPMSTQPDTKLRIPNQGLWAMQQNVRGNLIVNVRINTPTLSPNQFKLAQDLLTLMNSTI